MKRFLGSILLLLLCPLAAHATTYITPSTSVEYKIVNANSELVLGISGMSYTAGTAAVQYTDNGTADHLWHFLPMGSNKYNIENMYTHQVLGISSASTANGAAVVQWSDNGTTDHLWYIIQASDGNYMIQNVNSGLYLEVYNGSTSTSATIDQWSSTGCKCQEWTLTNTGTTPYPAPNTVSGTGIYVHDPYMLQDPSTHYYWLYGSHQTIAYSTNGSTFTYTTKSTAQGACTTAEGTYWITDDAHCPIIGPDFSSWSGLQTPPSANSGENVDVWAPSILYTNSTYYQYYSIPYEPSTGAEAVIGFASSSTPYGPWTDKGYVVASWTGTTSSVPTTNPWGFASGTTYNAIDPAPFLDASGNWWMAFGSWQDGTHLVQLSPSTGKRLNSTMYTLAVRSAGEEGPFVYYHSGYYYYFAPINVCCQGTSSTYRTIVGRSTSVTGPYVDRGGVALTSGGGTILVSTHGNIIGPGGGSVFTDTGTSGSSSQPTFVYHYYDGNNNGAPTLGINKLGFDSSGWPYLE